MQIKDIQQRHASVFNIRFGEKVKSQSGKWMPAKLTDQIRVTSDNRSTVQAFVDVYGGHVSAWNDAWQAHLPRTSIPIFVLPGQSVDQAWELYKGNVRVRACEGTGGIESKSVKPCMCNPDVAKRMADPEQCSIMTRLNFICPEVAAIGAGSLISHGLIAAETLPQAVKAAEVALKAGTMVPAILRCVLKTGEKRQYVIPQIEITGFSLNQLMAGEVPSMSIAAPQAAQLIESSSGGSQTHHSPSLATPATKDFPGQGETAVSANSPASASPVASASMRSSINKEAAKRDISADDADDITMTATGKYVDEASFSVDDVNKALDAIRKEGKEA